MVLRRTSVNKSFLTNEMLVNFEIRNRFGSIAAVFRKSGLEDYLRNATSILNKSSDINIPLTLDYSLIPQDITIATNTPEFCVRHVYEIRSEEATQNDQEQDAVHHGAIYEIIENSHYLTVEWQNNEISNSESEIEDRGDVISFSYVEPVNGNSYDEITSTYYEDVDWRNSIVSSEESCPELDFSGVNIETTENVGKAPEHARKCYLLKREENHGETESDIIQNYSRKTSSSAAQSHIYVTVLSNE
ncbi:unnamed protein product [Mytilus edulis]|uniref:Uncharacterized protein n=1 Tax=Mytilus edulis TaxID=6550 RepID=A0A8S3VFB5_MYTED|nr:unnamed protein product [Mytilus edulis]